MKATVVSGILATVMRTAAASTTPKRVGMILAVGVALALAILAVNVEASNLWTGPAAGGPGGPNDPANAPKMKDPYFTITSNGTMWLYPNGDNGKGGRAYGPFTSWGSYFHRGHFLNPSWVKAMKGHSTVFNRRGSGLGYHVGGGTSVDGGGWQGYTEGSNLQFDTGQSTEGAWPIPSGGRYLWPD